MQPTVVVLSVALVLLAAPVPSDAQQPGKIYRIGFLALNLFAPIEDIDPQKCPMTGRPQWQEWIEGLRERAYVLGQNLVIECRWTEGRVERAPALAAELVSLKPDLLVAHSTANVRAAKQATSTIPIVMLGVTDPVGRGLVASLAHPGGNVTGLTDTFVEMEGKRMQLLMEAVPTVTRVAVLSSPGEGGLPGPDLVGREREATARALRVTLQGYSVRDPADFERAFAAMTKAQAEALVVESHPFLFIHARRIVGLAARNRLPAMYPWRDFVEAGGLLAYDVNRPAIYRRLGFYVDKILKGAKPGDLPVEQPTKLDLLINLKTAKALGLTIPQSLLSRADDVFQ